MGFCFLRIMCVSGSSSEVLNCQFSDRNSFAGGTKQLHRSSRTAGKDMRRFLAGKLLYVTWIAIHLNPWKSNMLSFFQMVWEQEASLIIMLTTTVERGRVSNLKLLPFFCHSSDLVCPFPFHFLSFSVCSIGQVVDIQFPGYVSSTSEIRYNVFRIIIPEYGQSNKPIVFFSVSMFSIPILRSVLKSV